MYNVFTIGALRILALINDILQSTSHFPFWRKPSSNLDLCVCFVLFLVVSAFFDASANALMMAGPL